MTARTELRDALRVQPGAECGWPSSTPRPRSVGTRRRARRPRPGQLDRLWDLQDRFWAEAKRSVLVVLQGIDAAGKDGTIKKVMEAFNPQGCIVSSFKVPTPEELAHDFLWRIHQRVPGKGEIGIFNRSHYEDVLVVRVHELVPQAVWSARYEPDQRVRADAHRDRDDDRQVLPVHHRDEQRERFQERFDDPTKRWKFSLGDLEERKLWDDYLAAFEEALSKTSTDAAPWYVIPANRNWLRNLAVATILADTIAGLKPELSARAGPAARPRHRVTARVRYMPAGRPRAAHGPADQRDLPPPKMVSKTPRRMPWPAAT